MDVATPQSDPEEKVIDKKYSLPSQVLGDLKLSRCLLFFGFLICEFIFTRASFSRVIVTIVPCSGYQGCVYVEIVFGPVDVV